jgi:uncharacterized protein VirK/YbjX
VAIYSASGRAAEADQFSKFFRSIYAGTAHVFRKLYSGNPGTIIAKIRKFISDEPIVAAVNGHLKVVRALNGSGASALTKRYPNYVNKYATDYMAKSFSQRTRREILQFHHQYLAGHVTPVFYEVILNGGEILWSETLAGNRYSISVVFNHQFHSEGDVSLSFDKDGLPLYAISFTIVPGRSVGSASDQAMLIGVIQGRIGQAEEIRASTKACHDIAPPYLLLAASLSIAEVLGIGVVAGVTDCEQLAKSREGTACFFDYDAFWETLLVRKNVAGFYEGSIPLPEKLLVQTVSKHRGKVRLKRRMKKEIADQVGQTFARYFTKPKRGMMIRDALLR